MRAGVLSPSSTPVRFGFFPRRSPGSWFLPVSRESEAAMSAGKKNAKNNNGGAGARGAVPVHGGEGAEVAEESTQVVEYAAAIDVAKGFGMVCTRVPGSRPDRRRQKVWRAEAAGLEVWLASARDVKHLPGRGKSDRLDCVWHCKLNERGMLMRSFVPPEPVRDLRALT